MLPVPTGRDPGRDSTPSGPPVFAEISATALTRRATGLQELDAGLGGGLVTGQTVLFAGAPASGKTSFLLRAADRIGEALFVSGEESLEQLRQRGVGIESGRFRSVNETDPLKIEELADRWARALLVVDSVNVLRDPALPAPPDSPSQLKACAAILFRWAERSGVPVILVAHVTWENRLHGPRNLEHLVDTVCYYRRRRDGSRRLTTRKNRFGPITRVVIPEWAG